MKKYHQPVFAFGLSVAVLLFVLLLLWFAQFSQQIIEDKVIVREVAMMSLPPPPPPPIAVSKPIATPLTVNISGAGVEMQRVEIKVKTQVNIQRPDAPQVTLSTPDLQNTAINWHAFSLNDLDDLPRLLTSIKAVLPKSLSRNVVEKFIVKLDVMIDEQGRVSLIEVVTSPYPELKPEIDRIVKTSRFSAPKKDQQIVRARFIWPIEFNP